MISSEFVSPGVTGMPIRLRSPITIYHEQWKGRCKMKDKRSPPFSRHTHQ
jgi:hypothetical protein